MKKIVILLGVIALSFSIAHAFVNSSKKVVSCNVNCSNGSCSASGATASCSCSILGNPDCSATKFHLSSNDSQIEFQKSFLDFLRSICDNDIKIQLFNSQKSIVEYINNDNAEMYRKELQNQENLLNQVDGDFKMKVSTWINENSIYKN